jgi:protein-tyrosine phosphatase
VVKEIRFPSGVTIRACGLRDSDANAGWRTFGLYLDPRWTPTCATRFIDWPDFGVPSSRADAVSAIVDAYRRALSGARVEVGCAGGLGRTGTVLACMAVIAGVPATEAVGWVRSHYDVRAIETADQEEWVHWFAVHRNTTL